MTDKVLATYEGQQEIAEAIRGINLEALTQKAVWVDSVADMRELDAPQGITVATRGYYESNDGGNGFYYIRAIAVGDTDDGGSIIILENGNVAELIPNEFGVVNVRQFGAYGDKTHNDTVAIQNCMIFLQKLFAPLNTIYYPVTGGTNRADRRTGKIIFPSGCYLVSHNVFNDDRVVTGRSEYVGFTFEGTGKYSSVLLLETNGVDSWFFYSDASTQRFQRVQFADLGFRSDDCQHGNVVKLYSTGDIKQFRFHRCNFVALYNFIWTEGTGNADLNKITECNGTFYGNVITLDNQQSVQHDFTGSDIGTYGNWVYLKSGGGQVNVVGASMDFMFHEDYSPAGGNYVVYIDDTAGNATTTFSFMNCRVEVEAYMRSASNPPFGLVRSPYVNAVKQMRIMFDNVSFINGATYVINADGETVSSERRRIENAINIGNSVFVHLKDCVLLKNFFYTIKGTYNLGSPPYGGIVFVENCYDGKDSELPTADKSAYFMIQSRTTYTNNYGRLIGRGITDGSSETTGKVFAHDGDPNWRASGPNDMGALPIVRSVLQRNKGIPLPSGSNEMVIYINPNTFAKRIYIRKRASGTDSSAYQLHIGTEDKGTIIASSTSANGEFKDEHTIDVSDIDLSAYSVLRIWATGDSSITTVITNNVGYIEYM